MFRFWSENVFRFIPTFHHLWICRCHTHFVCMMWFLNGNWIKMVLDWFDQSQVMQPLSGTPNHWMVLVPLNKPVKTNFESIKKCLQNILNLGHLTVIFNGFYSVFVIEPLWVHQYRTPQLFVQPGCHISPLFFTLNVGFITAYSLLAC